MLDRFRVTLLFTLLLALATSSSHASVENLTLENAGFIGRYYHTSLSNPSSKKPVLVLGGSEGGTPIHLAETIAELGYPTLAVAYFGEGNLPGELEKIPLEYFNNAKAWLREKFAGISENITLVGWSKGAELGLLLASKDPAINQLVAIAPSSVVWAGILKDWKKVPGSSWIENGKELPFIPFTPSGPVTGLLDLYSQSMANRKDNGLAAIPVENIKAQVFLYSGGKDEIWPSSMMAKVICERMNRLITNRCHHTFYPELDHLLDYRFLDKSDPMHEVFAKSLAGD